MKIAKFVVAACAAVGMLVSAGCKSDCEKAYNNIEAWSKDSPEAKEIFE